MKHIRPERYQGYLQPWIDEILDLYCQGITTTEIADHIKLLVRTKVFPRYRGDTLDVSSGMISYVLRRIGAIGSEPVNPQSSFAKYETARKARQRDKIREWTTVPTANDNFTNNGRPLDMGGPRNVWLERSPWDER